MTHEIDGKKRARKTCFDLNSNSNCLINIKQIYKAVQIV